MGDLIDTAGFLIGAALALFGVYHLAGEHAAAIVGGITMMALAVAPGGK